MTDHPFFQPHFDCGAARRVRQQQLVIRTDARVGDGRRQRERMIGALVRSSADAQYR
ncbi:MAG TPA: hypothetical protein VGR26_06120 [Acidimicrobiales bacterium]|nr:hypothetical protein [Acidimicrobiales bacterium]